MLEFSTSETEVALLASLQPTDSVSVAASKLKGAASKSLRQLRGLSEPARILGGGYFAATTGANTSDELAHYLERDRFNHLLIRAGVPRLWKPSAYVGSYGDISKDHVRNYVRKWGSAAG